tara:strand:- start:77 stop:529 length:453 start_codon:yes stop_codon:yes gene_type:complete
MVNKFFNILFFNILLALPVKAELLIVNVQMENGKGPVIIAVYNNEKKEFFGKGKPNKKGNPDHVFIGKRKYMENTKLSFTFDIPFGEYAFIAFLDGDNNEMLSANFIGIPKEPFGFSNNARGKFGPPKWEDALVNFTKSNQKISINLKGI